MSYDGAYARFQENVRLLGHPLNDKFQWNLNTGFVQLTEALQSDLGEIQDRIEDIRKALELSK
jgi:DNA-directed RNA polymerase subunit L